jgi:hypothetical protein
MVTSFSLLLFSPLEIALLFVHPFRYLDGCNTASLKPPFLALTSSTHWMRCEKEWSKQTNHPSVFSYEPGKKYSTLYSVVVVGYY